MVSRWPRDGNMGPVPPPSGWWSPIPSEILIGESRQCTFKVEYPFVFKSEGFSFPPLGALCVASLLYFEHIQITVPFLALPPKKSRQNSTDIDFY